MSGAGLPFVTAVPGTITSKTFVAPTVLRCCSMVFLDEPVASANLTPFFFKNFNSFSAPGLYLTTKCFAIYSRNSSLNKSTSIVGYFFLK